MSKKRSSRNASKPSCNLSDLSTDDLRQLIWDEVRAVGDELKQSFDNELRSLKNKLTNIGAQLQQALALKDTVIAVEKAIDYTSQPLDDVYRVSLQALSRQVEQIAVGLALQTLDLDVHRRKSTLTIQGLNGDADEHEDDTRDACIDLAKTHLDVKDAKASDLAACHRLGKKAGSGIIVRFRDLRQRNQWLMGAKNLRNHTDNISLSSDLPPVLRPLKTELLKYSGRTRWISWLLTSRPLASSGHLQTMYWLWKKYSFLSSVGSFVWITSVPLAQP